MHLMNSRAVSSGTVVATQCDYERDGRQFGYLDIPSSRNESAWGVIRFPVCVIRNGEGPTVLFTGGNHGDEYEGPIALQKLARALSPEDIRGRVIILPALNYPAVRSGTRVSPIDGVNMNRAFPGKRDGTLSQLLAHYVTTVLLPMCDVVVDLHSGGKTMQFHPFACIHKLEDEALQARSRDLLLAFGAPISLVLEEIDNGGMLDTTVEESGKLFLAAEIGGGGTATAASVAIAERGVRNVLRHLGMLPAASASPAAAASGRSILDTSAAGAYLHSNHEGLFEMLADLGQEVRAGDAVAQVHSLTEPDAEPVVYRSRHDGLVIGRHFPGLIKQGDFLALIASPLKAGSGG